MVVRQISSNPSFIPITRLYGKFEIAFLPLAVFLMSSCLPTPSGEKFLWGVPGHYQQGKLAVTGLHRDINKGVALLEEAARRNPLYEDVLTLLGRGYYAQRRYENALEMLKRALTVNREDEIAWLFLGLTQLRLGESKAGLAAVKAGLGLLVKRSKPGYRGYEAWDIEGDVKRSIRRAVFSVEKAQLGNSTRLLFAAERMILTIDEEDFRRDRTRDDPYHR